MADWHIDFWRGVRDDAACTLARICDESAPCTKKEVDDLLAHALACGTPNQAAEAILVASAWMQAHCELTMRNKND